GDAWVFGNAWVSGDARVSGDALASGDAHYVTISPVGSERGVLTAFRQADNSIMVRWDCFAGTIEEFEKAVEERHGGTIYEKKYKALIPFIKAQLDDAGPGECITSCSTSV
ncbi:TPA: hypothetical protein R5S02_003186, partial [Salmonella enterica]|nr:hypothetical protein [Salmonella enterica]